MSFFHVSIFFKKLLSQKEPKVHFLRYKQMSIHLRKCPNFPIKSDEKQKNNNLRLVRKTINLAQCQWNTEGFIKNQS